jgi:hypothetical protein
LKSIDDIIPELSKEIELLLNIALEKQKQKETYF